MGIVFLMQMINFHGILKIYILYINAILWGLNMNLGTEFKILENVGDKVV